VAPAPSYPRVVVGPRYLPYDEGQPIPEGYHVEQRVRGGMVIPGAVLLGVSYLLGATVASADNYNDQTGWLLLPVAGPWLMLLMHKSNTSSCDPTVTFCSTTSSSSSDQTDTRFLLTSDGLVQAAGAVLLILGLRGRQVLVRHGIASLSVAPTRVGSAEGLVLGGRF
jgi:hypothetical protein